MKKTTLTLLIILGTFLLPAMASAQAELITLASFETKYGDYGLYQGRAHNIRQAASIVGEVTLQPSERFSFNERVGERTSANGFRRAPVIISGRLTRGLGGGVCQLASTIYAAALYSGLEIVEQHPHSRISIYTRPGLDATVDWGTKDLVIVNPYPFPVTMQVTIREGDRVAREVVSVVFTARQSIYDVVVRFHEQQIAEFDTRLEFSIRLPPGEQRVDEPGTPAIQVVVRRTLYPKVWLLSPIHERIVVRYPASIRIVSIGLPL